MYRRVMVPLEGSAFGAYAIPFALQIADLTGAHVDLVHVHVRLPEEGLSAITPYQYQNVTRHYAEWDHDELVHEREALREQAHRLSEETGLNVTSRVLSGPVAGALHDEADRFHADIIVMATHARTGLARASRGSVADLVVRRAQVPVLLVQPPDEAAAATPDVPEFRRVLVPLDGSTFSEDVLHPAYTFAELQRAEVRLIHVLEQRGWLPATNLGRLAGRTGDPVEVVHAVHATEGILAVARDWGADLIALATHGRGGLSRVLVGSTASDVLARTRLPVLLHRPPAAAWSELDGNVGAQANHA